jgi:hypothetical protein
MRASFVFALLLSLVPKVALAVPSYAFATATDFQSPVGCASWVEIAPPRTAHPCVESISSDPVARWAFGLIYVVNRFQADNIQILDPSNSFHTVREFSVGNGTNPQDIAVVSPTKAFVSLLNAPYLLVVDPSTGTLTDSIPLARFADGDGNPEAARMWSYGAGSRIFVALQRLQDFAPTDTSYIAVIDGDADTVLDVDQSTPGLQAIQLLGKNPNSDLEWDATRHRLLVCTVGDYGVLDGGVEAIDPDTYQDLGYETTEAKLGAQLGDVAVSASGKAYVTLSDVDPNGGSRLVHYDRDTGAQVGPALFATDNFSLTDIETNDLGELWVCDRTFLNPGLRVFSTTTDTQLAGPITTGVPPADVLFEGSNVADAVDPRPIVGSLAVLQAGPNPTRGEWHVKFAVGEGATLPTRLRVYDVRGALVDAVDLGPVGGGEHAITWRARRGLASGSYFFRLERGQESRTGRVILER